MAPARNDDDDWSDSDEEDLDQVETNVLLGVPDGTVDVDHDKIDAAVSRIGGLPVRESCIYSPARIHIDLISLVKQGTLARPCTSIFFVAL